MQGIMKKMKFYLVMLMAAMMTFGLAACGGDSSNDGGSSAPDYIGVWVIKDTQTRFSYTELTTTSWTNVNYQLNTSTGKVRKEVSSGSLSVNGNQITLGGNAPASNATYSISGNTMTVRFVQNGGAETETMTRISSADAAAKIGAWEALYIQSQNSNN